jgi:hypothetical protein
LTAFSRKVGDEELWGYMDLDGSIVLEPKWRLADRFSEGLAAVSVEKSAPFPMSPYLNPLRESGLLFSGKFNYINVKGETIVSGNFHAARPFGEAGLAAVWIVAEEEADKPAEKWAFVRRDGSIFVPGDFLERLAEFRDGRLVTTDAIYNAQGEKIFSAPENFRLVDAKDDSGVCLLIGSLNGPHRLVHRKSGKCYGPDLRYNLGRSQGFSEGFACVGTEAKAYGYIDRSGKMVIEPRFRSFSNFNSGYISISNHETKKIEYWNRKGKLFKER